MPTDQTQVTEPTLAEAAPTWVTQNSTHLQTVKKIHENISAFCISPVIKKLSTENQALARQELVQLAQLIDTMRKRYELNLTP